MIFRIQELTEDGTLKQLEKKYMIDIEKTCAAWTRDKFKPHRINLEESAILFKILGFGLASASIGILLEVVISTCIFRKKKNIIMFS